MPTSEVVQLQQQMERAFQELTSLSLRIRDIENALAGGIAAGGGLSALSVSAGIRAKLAQAGLHTIEAVRACNEDKLMEVARIASDGRAARPQGSAEGRVMEDFAARVEGIDARLSRLESLLGGSVDILEGLNFPEGLRIPAGQGITFAPGASPTETEGQLYYDATADALKLRGASAWETVLSQVDAQIDSSAVSNLASTTTETQIKTVTVSFPRAGKLLVWFDCNPYLTAASKNTLFRLKIGGTAKRSSTYSQTHANDHTYRKQVGFCWLETISASGNQTVTVTAQNSDAAFTAVFNDCTLLALALGL